MADRDIPTRWFLERAGDYGPGYVWLAVEESAPPRRGRFYLVNLTGDVSLPRRQYMRGILHEIRQQLVRELRAVDHHLEASGRIDGVVDPSFRRYSPAPIDG